MISFARVRAGREGLIFYILGCGALLCPSAAPGEAGQPGTSAASAFSLARAQQRALERNWDLLGAAAGVDAATAQKVVAAEFPNPTLSITSSKINVDAHGNSTSSGNGLWERSYDTVFAINQLFEIGGKRRSRRASAQAGFAAARAQFLDVKRTLDLGVAKAYLAAAQAEENVRVLEESAESMAKEAQLAAIRQEAGEISSSDRSQIEITAEKFQLDARAAQSTAAQARVALQVLLGDPHPDGLILLTDSLETLAGSSPNQSAATDVALRPDVAAATAAWEKADADLKLQRANRVPDPTVVAQYEHEPPDAPNSIGVGLSFPLPLWNRNRGGILAAEAARAQARFTLEKVRSQAQAEIATAHFAYAESAKRWEEYRDTIRPKSANIRQTVTYAYEKGGASLLDLLSTQRNDNEVRLAAAQAQADLAIASATLKAATTEIRTEETKK